MKTKVILGMVGILALLGLLCAMPVLSQLPIGIVACWTFDEGSGTEVSDSTGNGNTGTLVNGPQWVSGVKATALYFDGLDDYVSVPDSPTLKASGNAITVELWFKPTALLDVDTPALEIIDKGNEYTFYLNLGHFWDPDIDGRIGFLLVLQGTGWHWVKTTTTQWNAETWYHLTGTYDGNYMKIYVNGELQNSEPLSGDLHSESYPLAVGSYTLGGQWLFQGAIDEVAIYNAALASEEIQQHYQNLMPQMLIETIETWNLQKGTETNLKSQLNNALHLLNIGNENAAVHVLTAFIRHVEVLRSIKELTNDQADTLITGAQNIIDTIQ